MQPEEEELVEVQLLDKPGTMGDAAKTLGDESRWPELQAKFPAKRAGSVEEVANTIAFLASPRASYISGASIKIDGGLSVSKRGG